jgi:signal transduction histidine kinase
MRPDALLKSFSSFRAQMMAFIAITLLVTGIVIFLINLRLEARTTQVVDEYIQAIPRANDLVNYSIAEGLFLYNLVNSPEWSSLPVNSESVIRHILIVEEDGKIFDSTDREDVHQQLQSIVNQKLPGFALGDLNRDTRAIGQNEIRSLNFSIDTQREDGSSARRTVIIIISMNRLKNVKEAGDRARLLAFVALGLSLIFIIAVFTKRFTRPITDLERAAQRVTAGNLDFSVPVLGPKEVSTLSATFNGMLAGLRRNRELEEELQRAERSAVVGRLASGIAHEIRNPLNFINLSIDHLREKFGPQTAGPRAEYTHILTTIKDELARLNRLVSDFLSYGRPAKLKLREVDARSLIEEVRSLVAAQSEQQNVKISILQNGNGNSKVQADAEQLKTCFSNLMINAVQAMPEGGSLEITVSPNSSQVEIDFTDSGPGISPQALEQIFEPYYSTKETGIGLGLPLTKKIIEEHGGQIAVKSELDKGTVFTVTLPRNPN